MVPVKWSEFWEHWNTTHVPRDGLMIAWYRVVREAAYELSGGMTYVIANSISDDCFRNHMLLESARIGEPGEKRLVDGQSPSDIVDKFKELLESKNIPIPSSKYTPTAWSK
jgi:hypothetical protein